MPVQDKHIVLPLFRLLRVQEKEGSDWEGEEGSNLVEADWLHGVTVDPPQRHLPLAIDTSSHLIHLRSRVPTHDDSLGMGKVSWFKLGNDVPVGVALHSEPSAETPRSAGSSCNQPWKPRLILTASTTASLTRTHSINAQAY
jgi:hypothetical protein